MKFALLCYRTTNLGDEIQSLAAQQFLPHTDLLIDRDIWTSSGANYGESYKIILNGWFTHNPETWPPPAFLLPCLISMHITRERFRPTTLIAASKALLEAESLNYLKAHEPIGGRDLWTTSLLQRHGVDSYFSGCLTLTLGDGISLSRQDYICAVDLSSEQRDVLAARSSSQVLRLTHHDAGGGDFEHRRAKAARLLSLYARAKCVVTTRLHCALPCLALGTPVLLINEASDGYRFSGLLELVRHCTADEYRRGAFSFDFERPTANETAHLHLRNKLSEKVEAHTGGKFCTFSPATSVDMEPSSGAPPPT